MQCISIVIIVLYSCNNNHILHIKIAIVICVNLSPSSFSLGINMTHEWTQSSRLAEAGDWSEMGPQLTDHNLFSTPVYVASGL